MKIRLINYSINNNKKIDSEKIDLTPVGKNKIQQSTTVLNNSNKYLINFKGLNKALSKKIFSNVDILLEEIAKHPKSNGVVGNLPSEWVRMIPKQDRADKIKRLYVDFKKAAIKFRKNNKTSNFELSLRHAFNKAGIIKPNQKLLLKEIGVGSFGTCYRLSGIDNREYVIKVFHFQNELDDCHGNPMELQRAIYWQKNVGKNTQKVPFYFGDTDAGYMVTKYIDISSPPNSIIKDETYYGLEGSDDVGENIVRGYEIDYGGINVMNTILYKNSIARHLYKKFDRIPKGKRLELFDNFLINPKYKNNPDVKIGLISVLELLPKNIQSVKLEELLKITDFNDTKTMGIKEAFVYNLKLLSDEKRLVYFNKILTNANSSVKVALANNLDLLPLELRCDKFDELLNNSDIEVKEALANNLGVIPRDELLNKFNDLLKIPSNRIKKSLSYVIELLPEEKKIEKFNELLIGADIPLKIDLANNLDDLDLDVLSDKELNVMLNKFLVERDNRVKKALGDNLYSIPKTKRFIVLKKLLRGSNDLVKEVLIEQLGFLSTKERLVIYKELLKTNSQKVRVALTEFVSSSSH